MAELDAKGIGLAAKDIVLGVGTVAAGATLGPAGAEGVSRAGSALDRILKMVGVLDRRLEASPADGGGAPSTAPAFHTAGSATTLGAQPRYALGDAKIATDHLRGVGWPEAAVQQILAGPEHSSESAAPTSGVRMAVAQSPFLFEQAGYAPDLRGYDADALMLRGVGITTERLKPDPTREG